MLTVLAFVSVAFICVPVLGAGIWLTRTGKTATVKCMGAAIMCLGSLPALLILLFFYWMLFQSE